MTLPPCYTPPDPDPDDDTPPDPSRRAFVLGSAAATAGMLVAPLLAAPAPAAAAVKAPPEHATKVVLNVNGKAHELLLDPRTTLLDTLREHLDLTGTKKRCEKGEGRRMKGEGKKAGIPSPSG